MTTIDHADPFASADTLLRPDDNPERITGGRYRLPDLTFGPDGEPVTGKESRKGGWQRVTTLVKAIGDARALDLWHQRRIIAGLVLRPDLYDLACGPNAIEDRALMQEIAEKALAAAGADIGANLGTAFHGFADGDDLGIIHHARPKWRGRLLNYSSGMQAHGLQVIPEYVERKVVILRYGLAGKLDRILKDLAADVLRIGDLKSQKRFWTWVEISAQLAAYQMADAMWDRAKRCYVQMPKVADDLGVVVWAPQEHPERLDGVDFFNVDLEHGRRRLELCAKVDRERSEGRSVHQTTGTLRPLPEMTQVEAYAARLDAVGSPAEGSALWTEITDRGLSETPELVELAQEIASRFLQQAG